jgi:hypothetical protein
MVHLFVQYVSRRKLLLLEAVIAVLSPLFEGDAEGLGCPMSECTDSEISIFLVCAELRVALSMCQYVGKLPSLLKSENK